MWGLSPTRPSDARSKKLAQAPSQAPVGDPSEEERGFRVEDGGGFGSLRRALQPLTSGGLLRRETLPAHRRCERSSADEARVNRALRFGVRARRGLLGLDELRAFERLARAGGHRAPQKTGVCSFDVAPGRGGLPQSREDPSGCGQSLHPYGCGLLRELLGRRSARALSKGRVL